MAARPRKMARGSTDTMDYTSLEVKQTFQLGERKIVLFDTDNVIPLAGQSPNLVCYASDGSIDWIAELPTSQTGETYVEVTSINPLVAYAFFSWKCTIDTKTGRIIEQEFLK